MIYPLESRSSDDSFKKNGSNLRGIKYLGPVNLKGFSILKYVPGGQPWCLHTLIAYII